MIPQRNGAWAETYAVYENLDDPTECGPGELDKLPSLLDNAYRTRQSLLADRVTATDADRRSASQIALRVLAVAHTAA